MNQITDKIWLGDLQDAQNISVLQAANIKAVLSLLENLESYFSSLIQIAYQKAQIQHTLVSMIDGGNNQDDAFRQAFAVLEGFQDQGLNTLVHCGAGVSRSPSVVIGWLMKHAKLTWDEALNEVGHKRPVIFPNPALKRTVLKVLGAWPYGSLGSPATPLAE